MVFYSRRPNLLLDKIIVTIWLTYLFLNVFSHYIVRWFGGVGTLVVVYAFFLYFYFLYGSSPGFGRIADYWFILFSVLYCFLTALFDDAGLRYDAGGVILNLSVWHMITFIPIVLSAVAVIQKSSPELLKWIRLCFVAFSCITITVSINLLFFDSTVIRLTATGSSDYYPLAFDFQTVAGLSVIVPILLAATGEMKYRVLWIVYIVAVIIGVVMASLFISILAMIFGMVIFFALRIRNKWIKYSVSTATLAFVVYEGVSGEFILFLQWLFRFLPIPEITKRLNEMMLFYENGVIDDATSRIRIYRDAIAMVVRHPITGNYVWDTAPVLSGHSAVLDIWGGCGILILAVLLLFIISVYRYNRDRYCFTQNQKAAVFASTAAFLLFIILNPLFSSPILMVFWIMAPMFLQRDSHLELYYEHSNG